jgi:hypothetical protein
MTPSQKTIQKLQELSLNPIKTLKKPLKKKHSKNTKKTPEREHVTYPD